jgi:hypothetical protein
MLYGITLAVVGASTPLLHPIPRNRGQQPLWHVEFLVAAAALLLWIPAWVQDELFSPGGVLLIGTLVPIYESVVAITSLESADDVATGYCNITGCSFTSKWHDCDEFRPTPPRLSRIS